MGQENDFHERIFGVTKDETSIVVTAGAYSASDVVGGLIVFDVHSAGGGGIIADIYFIDANNQTEAYTLYIFDAEPTAIADNGAWPTGIDIDDLDNMIAKISLSAGLYTTINSLDWAHIQNVDQKFEAEKGNLYMYAVCATGPTQAAITDIKASMLIQKN